MSYFLKNIAPTFMWCSALDLFLMYEQINWEAEWCSFKQRFHQIFQEGIFLSKPDPDKSRNRSGKTARMLYIRKDNHSKVDKL